LCGIIGILAKNKIGESSFDQLDIALDALKHRGPDSQDCKIHSNVAFGHVRLSIIDADDRSNQPFCDASGRYTLIFNGEIYNFKELRNDLEIKGVEFVTNSDTEVLLHLLIKEREKALPKLNGFFAFAFYDNQRDEILFARDRMGIKPIIIYEDGDKFILCSELNSLFHFDIDKTIDADALNHYLGLTYIPASHTIIEKAYKIKPGEYGIIREKSVVINAYTEVRRNPYAKLNYEDSVTELQKLMNSAVERRLISDVPLGCFLSGGVDSSVVATIAAKQKEKLDTFSIGFDHKYFDESGYARQVADKIGSNHHEFILTKKNFEDEFENFLEAIDEPFADSSAFATFLLAKETRKEVTVALSGDGADELFGGYNKHKALLKSEDYTPRDKILVKGVSSVLGSFSNNRTSKWGQINRKVQKMNSGLKLDIEARYWHWCHFVSIEDVVNILKPEHYRTINWEGYMIQDVSDSLIADQHFVLANDMLKKVDLMSMANSLEVRTPFLDPNVVDFANSLPLAFKLGKNATKRILKDAYREELPEDVIDRPKKGFEIPLQEWLGDQISEILNSDKFSQEFIEEQGIFNYDGVRTLLKKVSNKSFGDRIYLVWSLLIFQHWWKKYMT
jgi:asparagine synthase (glutamine-hydrolysing)